MPIVTVQVTREGTSADRTSVSPEEKAAIISGVSEVLLNVLNKPLDSTYVIIEEVELDNWGWGGVPAAQYRAQRSAKAIS
ncbi:4-oxalocrotonate tautomerase [Ensifer adhaerens]|uniref:4-oxalocrotonate tautomerase n=1 Tax=Ensifer adhaerens TaxID=106592 RepID=A0ACC5SS07_ENSAD|nr:4-oxalocrotonate tautomerase family protein [Ensifer adhaerens]MBP1871590.1 4-oxalocrotonate tautomerase [Ensifer adhaerens]